MFFLIKRFPQGQSQASSEWTYLWPVTFLHLYQVGRKSHCGLSLSLSNEPDFLKIKGSFNVSLELHLDWVILISHVTAEIPSSLCMPIITQPEPDNTPSCRKDVRKNHKFNFAIRIVCIFQKKFIVLRNLFRNFFFGVDICVSS